MSVGPKIGYVAASADLAAPGDRRRFVHYAHRRHLPFEIADPVKQYDVVVISAAGDISPWVDCPRTGTKVIFDLVDAYLAVPRSNPKALLRGLAKFAVRQNRRLLLNYHGALRRLCARADSVVCSTDEQRATILRFCPNVHRVLDFHTGEIRRIKSDYRAGDTFNLVWEGLPFTIRTLRILRPVLRKLSQQHKLALHVVTDTECGRYLQGRVGRQRTWDVIHDVCPNTYLHAWNADLLASIVTTCDLAVIPIPLHDPLLAGKPENKLLLFWRMGMPVLASATPAYVRAMGRAGVDMVCRNEQDWLEKLERYVGDEPARREAGQRGRALADTFYGEGAMLQAWDEVFASIQQPGTASEAAQ